MIIPLWLTEQFLPNRCSLCHKKYGCFQNCRAWVKSVYRHEKWNFSSTRGVWKKAVFLELFSNEINNKQKSILVWDSMATLKMLTATQMVECLQRKMKTWLDPWLFFRKKNINKLGSWFACKTNLFWKNSISFYTCSLMSRVGIKVHNSKENRN